MTMIKDIVNNGLRPAATAGEANFTPVEKIEKSDPEAVESTNQQEQRSTEPEPQALQTAVSKLNDYVQNIQRTLSFTVEENTGITVVQVYDSETEELIRQIPAEV